MSDSSRSFPATLFAAPSTPESGELSVGAHDLCFEGARGSSFVLPFSELELRLGGFEKDLVFCRAPSMPARTLSVRAEGFVAALEAHAGAELARELGKLAEGRRTRRRGAWLSLLLVATALTAVLGLLLLTPRLAAQAALRLPTSVDRELGAVAAREAEAVGVELAEPAATRFLEEIVERLRQAAPERGFAFRVRIVDGDEVNAFALPGGQLVVFRGLLEKATEPEEVAGVLAHEMAHVLGRHGLKNLAHSLGLGLGLRLVLGDAEGLLGLGGRVASAAARNDYSREQENEADAVGVELLLRAGMDPKGLVRFFELLAKEPGSELSGALNWLSTHPEHEERIERVHALIARAEPVAVRPFESDFDAVKRALLARRSRPETGAPDTR